MPPVDPLPTVHDLGATLAALKESVRSATDFMVPWLRFQEEFVDVYGLYPPGEVRSNVPLVRAFAQLADKHLGVRAATAESRFLYVPEHHFWHGYSRLDTAWVFFFCFDDVNVGLAGFKRGLDAREVTLIRMTTVPISKGPPPGTVQ